MTSFMPPIKSLVKLWNTDLNFPEIQVDKSDTPVDNNIIENFLLPTNYGNGLEFNPALLTEYQHRRLLAALICLRGTKVDKVLSFCATCREFESKPALLGIRIFKLEGGTNTVVYNCVLDPLRHLAVAQNNIFILTEVR